MRMQYTIRAVPSAIDSALRRRARAEDKSLNEVLIETLARGLEIGTQPQVHADLDDLIGTWQEDPLFNQVIADFEKVDDEAWK